MDAGPLILWLAQDSAEGKPALDLPMLLMTAGILLLIVVLFGNLRKNLRRRGAVEAAPPRERMQAVNDQSQAATSIMERRTAQAAEITRELTALLDNRSQKLEILIQHADERIARLERLSSEAEGRLTPRHTSTAPVSDTAYANDALKQQIYDLADQGQKPGEIAQRLGQHAGKVELILALRRA